MTSIQKQILAACCALVLVSFGSYKFYGYFQERRFENAVIRIATIQLEEFMLDRMPNSYKDIPDVKTETIAATRDMTDIAVADRKILPDGNTLVETVTTTVDPVFLVDLAQHIVDKKKKGEQAASADELWRFIKTMHQNKEVHQYIRNRFTMQKLNGEWRRIH